MTTIPASNEKVNGVPGPVLLEAKNITLPRQRIDREIIPLGNTQVEVELAEVDLNNLKLDETNPRVAFKLQSAGIINPTQADLERLLWEDPDVKLLKQSISLYGGLIEALIVTNDGVTLEGNCRLASIRRLNAEADGKDPKWQKVKVRILAPGIDRSLIEMLLGELHFAGKNMWTAFEQASHLYNMSQRGETVEDLAGRYRQSKSSISAKLRAFALMRDQFVPKARDAKLDNPDRYWSWFEELYKTCKPSKAGSEKAERVIDGPELEAQFCNWVVEKKLPKAEQVRKLAKILDNKDAMAVLPVEGIEKAMEVVAEGDPTVNSKLWKQLQATAELLTTFPIDQLDALREGDVAKTKIFTDLSRAIEHVRKQATI